jgi:excisionase family DNA binding protein
LVPTCSSCSERSSGNASRRRSLVAKLTARWLSVSAAADHLGVSERAVRRRIERGTIAYTRFGTRILVDRRALDVELDNRIRGNHPNG